MDLAEISGTYIWFAQNVGDIVPVDPSGRSTDTFNYNTLYRVSDQKGGVWYFRFSGEWFDQAKTHRSAFYAVQWADSKWPVLQGKYLIDSVSAPRPQAGPMTFATIGDSMTWFGQGQYFRCKLAAKLPNYRFIGSNTDSFGYGHDGHGGDNTTEVLARLKDVPPSDVYFLLIGANDSGYAPSQTANHISKIATRLLAKKQGARVYIATLPARGDARAGIELERTAEILSWYRRCACHNTVKLIDIGAAMRRTPDALSSLIMPDHIHPNLDGYRLISRLIAAKVSDQSAARAGRAVVPSVAQR